MSAAGSSHQPGLARLYALVSLMTFFWAINYVVMKIALRELPPLLTMALRTSFAGVLMLGVYRWNALRSGPAEWRWRDVPLLVLMGLLGVGGNQLCFVLGLSRTSVAHAAFIVTLIPILVLIIASLTGQEPFSPVRLGGLLLAMAGVAFLQAGKPAGAAASASWIGDGYIFLAAVAFAVYTIIGKRIARRIHGITVNTFAYGGAALTLLPVTMYYATTFPLTSVSLRVWVAVVFMSVFPSVLCYLIYSYALTRISASQVSAFAYLQPVIAATSAFFVLGETLTPSILTGGALVLAGVFVAERLG